MLADLDLSEEQLERIAEIKMDGMSHFAQVGSSMGSLMRQVARELAKEQINKEKVKEIHQQILAERQKHGESMIDHVIAFAEVLTPEQRKKMKTKAIRRFLGMDRHRHDHDHGHDHDEHEHDRGRGR
jgi:Spy/CpxP family protein refolding chaperone